MLSTHEIRRCATCMICAAVSWQVTRCNRFLIDVPLCVIGLEELCKGTQVHARWNMPYRTYASCRRSRAKWFDDFARRHVMRTEVQRHGFYGNYRLAFLQVCDPLACAVELFRKCPVLTFDDRDSRAYSFILGLGGLHLTARFGERVGFAKDTLSEGRHLLFKLVCASVTSVHVLAHPFNVLVRFLDIALEFLAYRSACGIAGSESAKSIGCMRACVQYFSFKKDSS